MGAGRGSAGAGDARAAQMQDACSAVGPPTGYMGGGGGGGGTDGGGEGKTGVADMAASRRLRGRQRRPVLCVRINFKLLLPFTQAPGLKPRHQADAAPRTESERLRDAARAAPPRSPQARTPARRHQQPLEVLSTGDVSVDVRCDKASTSLPRRLFDPFHRLLVEGAARNRVQPGEEDRSRRVRLETRRDCE